MKIPNLIILALLVGCEIQLEHKIQDNTSLKVRHDDGDFVRHRLTRKIYIVSNEHWSSKTTYVTGTDGKAYEFSPEELETITQEEALNTKETP